jgi:hypothetical protein
VVYDWLGRMRPGGTRRKGREGREGGKERDGDINLCEVRGVCDVLVEGVEGL